MEGYAVERDVRRMPISEPTCRVPTLPHRHTGKKVVMNGTHMLAAIVYSSVLALGVSSAAIAQDDTAKKAVQRSSLNVHQSADTRQGETEVTQGGNATQDVVVVPAMDRAPLMGMAVHNGQGKELGLFEAAPLPAFANARTPLIAVIGINDAAETTDYLIPYGSRTYRSRAVALADTTAAY